MARFEERLRREVASWRTDGLVSPAQGEAILARYAEPAHSRFAWILAWIGAAFVSIGITLLVAANWDRIGAGAKLGALTAALVTANGLGWRLRTGMPKAAEACFVIGAALFLGGISLVGQIFHLRADPAAAMLLWWAGIAAIPFLAESRGAQAVSVAAGLAWVFTASWGGGGVFSLYPHSEDVGMGCAAFAYFFGAALWFIGAGGRGRLGRMFAGVHRVFGLLLMHGTLYALGFLRHETVAWGAAEPAALLPVAAALAIFGAGAVLAWRSSPAAERGLFFWVLAGAVVPAAVLAGWDLGDGGWLWSGVAWLTLFLLDFWLIRAGLLGGNAFWVNVGVVAVGLNVFTRFFDLFGKMFDGGVFFVVAGALVLGVGCYLERKRRAWMARMKGARP